MVGEMPNRDGLREIGKRAVRAEIAQRAIVLLDARGFDETTVEEIAAEVGVSPRTFFRHFSTKEEVVIGDLLPLGPLIADALQARPQGEPVWAALRASLQPLEDIAASAPENVRRSSRVALSTPGLRAKTIERHTLWADSLTPILARRMTADARPELAAAALAQSAFACLYVATLAWSTGGSEAYSALIDDAFSAVGSI